MLNREICKACYEANQKTWQDHWTDPHSGWHCWQTKDRNGISTYSDPPKNCLCAPEHAVSFVEEDTKHFAPGIRTEGGETWHPPGWMWTLAFAMKGCEWAVEECKKPEFEQVKNEWLRQQKEWRLKQAKERVEKELAKIESDLAAIRI